MKVQNRRIFIFQKMLNNEEVVTSSLAKTFDVSIKTIQNDMNYLKEIYPDIISIKKGVYKLSKIPDYMEEFKQNLIKTLIYNLASNVFREHQENIDLIFPNMKNKQNIFEFNINIEKVNPILFDQILNMINWNFSLKIIYEENEITIHPLKIINLDGKWFLKAVNLTNNQIKNYHLNKIEIISSYDENLLGNIKVS